MRDLRRKPSFQLLINLCLTIHWHGWNHLAFEASPIFYLTRLTRKADIIADVLIICPTSHRSIISHYAQSDSSSSFPSLRIDLQTFDESQELGAGTCTILRHYTSRIQQDFIVLPCDLIPPPSLALSHLLNKFRAESTSDGAIMTACFFEPRRSDKASPFDEWSNVSLQTPIVWDQLSDTLLHVDTNDDADHEPENIVLNMNMMSR